MNATSTPSGAGVKTSFTSFEDILSQVLGLHEVEMEGSGACSTQATTMFNTLESVSRSELALLKASSAEYAGLLATDFGRYLEANVGDAETLRLDAVLASSAATSTPGSLEQPYYASSGAGGTGITPPPTIDPALKAGLGCLPQGVDGSRLTLGNKLLVLNCLIFSTPHSFWVKEDDGVREAEALRTDARWSWIGTGDWECSFSPDGPLPSCLKHDVTYSSLKKFAGGNDSELDEAWNPRNKALSDMKFRADIMVHGCQDSDAEADDWVCPPINSLGISTNLELSWWYYFGVAWLHSLGWPYTHYDIEHMRRSTYRFTEYHVPSVADVQVSSSPSPLMGMTNYTVSWTYDPGTVRTATVLRYRLCWISLKSSAVCAVIGVVCVPLAALASFVLAKAKGMRGREHALRGARYSALLLLPWIYFTVRMGGAFVPRAVVAATYGALYTCWMALICGGYLGYVLVESIPCRSFGLEGAHLGLDAYTWLAVTSVNFFAWVL